MKLKFPKLSFAAAALIVIGLGTSLQAVPLVLAPGGSGTPGNIGSLGPGTEVAAAFNVFNTGTVSGKVGVQVLSGVASNPYSGLTFVYEVKNTSTTGTEGITDFLVGGWAGFNIALDYANSGFHFAPTANPVQPGPALRSATPGDELQFTFPPGSIEPPILLNEISWRLIVYTNATAWDTVTGTIKTSDFDGETKLEDTEMSAIVETLTAKATVPDNATTALLLGLGLVTLRCVAPRRKLA